MAVALLLVGVFAEAETRIDDSQFGKLDFEEVG